MLIIKVEKKSSTSLHITVKRRNKMLFRKYYVYPMAEEGKKRNRAGYFIFSIIKHVISIVIMVENGI